MLATIVSVGPSLAEKTKSSCAATVPVFYVTDRKTNKRGTYGPLRVGEVNTASRIAAGITIVSLPQDAKRELRSVKESSETPTDCKSSSVSFQCQTAADLSNEFDIALKAELQRLQTNEVFVFVHGFNTSFNAAATSAAHLALASGGPVILYSWPSASKLYRYALDECNNEWSQEHFNQFLEHLLQLKKSNSELQFNIVAHSMGNRLLVRGGPIFSGKQLFRDIYMVNPDIDAETFVHYLYRYMPRNGIAEGARMQLLVSRKDKALAAAEALFGGYTRLGQGVDVTLSALTSPHMFGALWSHCPLISHANSEQENGPRVESSIAHAFRIYDVTALDRGFIGHHIPFDFIASMHRDNKAPQGYSIAEGNSRGCNRLSKFFAHKMKENIKGPSGKVYTVMKSTPVPKVN